MKTQHTPGPWQLNADNRIVFVPTNGFGNDNIAFINPEGKAPDLMEANARLIAAAPDLLEALKLAKEELTFLFAQDQNTKFWTEESEARISAINAVLKKIES